MVTGSLAFVGASRVVLLAIEDPEDRARSLLLSVKDNLGPKAKGLGYRIVSHEVGDGVPMPHISTSRVEWDESLRTSRPTKLSQAVRRSPKTVEDAETFLRNELGFGERPAKEVIAAAEAESISPASIRHARENLGVVVTRKGFGKDGFFCVEFAGFGGAGSVSIYALMSHRC